MKTVIQMRFQQFFLFLSVALLAACSNGPEYEKLQKLEAELATLKENQSRQADELAIRELAHKFSDAANRKDGAMFQSLWAENGSWVIGPPINAQFSGKATMGESVTRMLGLWDFFVQLTGPGVVELNNDKATARFYVNEIARGKDGKGNYNLSMYEDELIKIDGKWYFVKRTYKTIYQDAPVYKGLVQSLN